MATRVSHHEYGQPDVSFAGRVRCLPLITRLVEKVRGRVGVPPVHCPEEELPGSMVDVQIGHALDAVLVGGVRPSATVVADLAQQAVYGAVLRLAPGSIQVVSVAEHKRGEGLAPDVRVSFSADGGDAAEAARAALTSHDTLRVDVRGHAREVRWRRAAPLPQHRGEVIVKLHGVPAEVCVKGLSQIVVAACGGGEVVRERRGAVAGCPGLGKSSEVLAWVEPPPGDPYLFGLPDVVDLGGGVSFRVDVQRRGVSAEERQWWRQQVRHTLFLPMSRYKVTEAPKRGQEDETETSRHPPSQEAGGLGHRRPNKQTPRARSAPWHS